MPIKGITQEEEKIILGIISSYDYYEFYYYGSRVKGNFRPTSDLDILVMSKDDIDLNDIEDLNFAFDDSRLPFIVNLSYDLDEKFYKLIEKNLVKIV